MNLEYVEQLAQEEADSGHATNADTLRGLVAAQAENARLRAALLDAPVPEHLEFMSRYYAKWWEKSRAALAL